MAILPTVDQFPTFADTHSWLAKTSCQCIWYLPDKGRRCCVRLQKDEKQSALQLATMLLQNGSLTGPSLQTLAEMAERSCCGRHHRNKIWGSKLSNSVAFRWQLEIRETLSIAQSRMAPIVKEDNASQSIKVDGLPKAEPVTVPVPVAQAFQDALIHRPSLVTEFAAHVVFEGETLASTLLSPIQSSSARAGSVYIFTYAGTPFREMLKIGYTRGDIMDRLDDWAQCGHGYPRLLSSYRDVYRPERVELLTHFELVKCWYALRWCSFHVCAHIEWFKIAVAAAEQIVGTWALWMHRATPYDRRGNLSVFWQGVVGFLVTYTIEITAELMMQIQEVEEGRIDVSDFFDDDALRRHRKRRIKQEEI